MEVSVTRRVQAFVSTCLRHRFDTISKEVLRRCIPEASAHVLNRKSKWQYIGRSLGKDDNSIIGRPKNTWRKTVEEEWRICGETCRELKFWKTCLGYMVKHLY